MRDSTVDTVFLSGEILVESIIKASLSNGGLSIIQRGTKGVLSYGEANLY